LFLQGQKKRKGKAEDGQFCAYHKGKNRKAHEIEFFLPHSLVPFKEDMILHCRLLFPEDGKIFCFQTVQMV